MRLLVLVVFAPGLTVVSMLAGCTSSPAATPSVESPTPPAEPVRSVTAAGEAHVEIAGVRLDGAWLDDLYGHSTGNELAIKTVRSEKSIEIQVGDANQDDGFSVHLSIIRDEAGKLSASSHVRHFGHNARAPYASMVDPRTTVWLSSTEWGGNDTIAVRFAIYGRYRNHDGVVMGGVPVPPAP